MFLRIFKDLWSLSHRGISSNTLWVSRIGDGLFCGRGRGEMMDMSVRII